MPHSALFKMIAPSEERGDAVDRALQVIRKHLDMDVAYVSEFVDNQSVFRKVDAPGLEAMIKPGDSRSLDDVYCKRILAGEIPEMMPDTSQVPAAMAMPITAALPIGAHLSVPIRLADGECYGMFCCLSFGANPSLNARDHQMMKAFSELAAYEITREMDVERGLRERRERIESVLASGGLSLVYQPIFDIAASPRIVGYEALSRFSPEPQRGPDVWFAEAEEVDRRIELELMAIQHALTAVSRLPDETFLTLNVSPATALSDELTVLLRHSSLDRLVLEITEQLPIDDYDAVLARLTPLCAKGMRLAVDDAGAGYSSLKHIFKLKPDLLKFDMSLTRDVDRDPMRQALIVALAGFAQKTGSRIVAEGVETEAELAALRKLGVGLAQGYLLARPAPLDEMMPETLGFDAPRKARPFAL